MPTARRTGAGTLPDAAPPPTAARPARTPSTRRHPICLVDGKSYKATIETTAGTVHVNLRPDIAPNTVNSFVNLARFHYFDDTTCHRAIRNFVVQCGDPTATGQGGPGYEFDDELGKIEPYEIGSVAMANAGPNTNGSQFFLITGDDGAALPPQLHTVRSGGGQRPRRRRRARRDGQHRATARRCSRSTSLSITIVEQ